MTPHVKFSLYSAAAGKAVLHALPELERENYLKNLKIKPNTDKTAKTKKELEARLVADTENGVTFSYGENSVGVIALAVPILGENQYPLGALSIVVPEVRFNETLKILCMELLINAGKKIEFELLAS
jgi:DNA-binding IclR family transcriptional regulator